MKSCSSPGGVHRQSPRRTLRLIVLTASATILTVTVINLLLLSGPGGVPFHDPASVAKQIPAPLRASVACMALAALAGLTLLARLASVLAASLDRARADCAAFAQALAGGRFSERMGLGDNAPVPAADLNRMAERLEQRFGRLSHACAPLQAIAGELEGVTRQVAAAIRGRQAGGTQALASLEGLTLSAGTMAAALDQLEAATATATRARGELSLASRTVTACGDRLSTWMGDAGTAVTEATASGRETGAGVVKLLAAAGAASSSLARLDASIRQVETITLHAAAISEEVARDAEAGRRAAHEATAGMQTSRESSHVASSSMLNLWQRVEDIGPILSVIDEVAEQTDLLALNATIIAAQAGEQGRGFAVVADEIRELAERSSSCTREITAVIEGILNETRRAMDAIARAEASIAAGQKQSRNSCAVLERIVDGVRQGGAQIDGIALAAAEQTRGSRAIGDALGGVVEMAQSLDASWSGQSHGTTRILTSLERLRLLADQIRTSQGEQCAVFTRFDQALGDTADPLERLRQACAAQQRESNTAAGALDTVRHSSSAAAGNLAQLENTVSGLKRQLLQLRQELADASPEGGDTHFPPQGQPRP